MILKNYFIHYPIHLTYRFNEIFIHGLGASITRAINLALQIQQAAYNSVSLSVNTSTVELIDDLEPKTKVREIEGKRERERERERKDVHI